MTAIPVAPPGCPLLSYYYQYQKSDVSQQLNRV